jgi:two-component system response regulator FixJ
VVDGDAAVRAQLRAQLKTLGIAILEFESADRCLASADLAQMRCIVSEVSLPDLSGVELLRKLRLQAPDVPVILYTREADVPTAVAAMREGATDFIEKPAIITTVFRRVSQLLENERPEPGPTAVPSLDDPKR